MTYVLIGDSTTDLGYRYMRKHQVAFLPFNYTIKDQEFFDDMGENTDISLFYRNMKQGAAIPITAQVNVVQYKEFFQPYLQDEKDVIYLCFSSGLSGSFNSAQIAARELEAEFPDRKIAVIDSLAASMGEGLLLWDAVEQRDQGADFETLVEHITKRVQQTNHWFTVDDLNHLYRGGRVSKTSAVLGTVLNIKPILNVDEEGHLIPREKVRGRKKALIHLAEKVEQYIVNSEKQTILISHGDALEDAQLLAEEIARRIKVKGFYFSQIGPVIGAHSGPGTIAVFFFGESRKL